MIVISFHFSIIFHLTLISSVSDDEISRQLDEIISNNEKIIEKQGLRAVSPLMGIAMKDLRGKASGEKINKLLIQKIENIISS